MTVDLDSDTVVVLTVLEELAIQCKWALARMNEVRDRLSNSDRIQRLPVGGPAQGHWDEWFQNRRELFGAIQSFLTCAGIADSLLTGRGPPRPRGWVGLSEEQRLTIRKELRLPEGFEIGGRPQRNSLIHIEERIVAWSSPGGMRGDFGIMGIDNQDPEVLRQILRVIDPKTLRFAVMGDVCSLNDVQESLRHVLASSSAAVGRIIDRVSSSGSAP